MCLTKMKVQSEQGGAVKLKDVAGGKVSLFVNVASQVQPLTALLFTALLVACNPQVSPHLVLRIDNRNSARPRPQCGFTPQYKGLQSVQDKYSQQGFSVLAFPCNGGHLTYIPFVPHQPAAAAL